MEQTNRRVFNQNEEKEKGDVKYANVEKLLLRHEIKFLLFLAGPFFLHEGESTFRAGRLFLHGNLSNYYASLSLFSLKYRSSVI